MRVVVAAILMLGGVMYGWNEYLNLVDAPDAKDLGAKYDTYADYFLASMAELEKKHQKRLVQVLDHFDESRRVETIQAGIAVQQRPL